MLKLLLGACNFAFVLHSLQIQRTAKAQENPSKSSKRDSIISFFYYLWNESRQKLEFPFDFCLQVNSIIIAPLALGNLQQE